MAKRGLPSLMFIVSFLICLSACAPNSDPPAASSPNSIASLELFPPENVRQIFKRSCESCHGYDGRGISGIAPDMLRPSNRTAEQWAKYFSSSTNEPRGQHPGGQMPSAVWMNQGEINTVAAYLAQLNGQVPAPAEAP